MKSVGTRTNLWSSERRLSPRPISMPRGMASPLHSAADALRRSARSVVVRSGREDQARTVVGRMREARSAFDPSSRRMLRDEHAMRVVLATALRHDGNAIDVGANQGDT